MHFTKSFRTENKCKIYFFPVRTGTAIQKMIYSLVFIINFVLHFSPWCIMNKASQWLAGGKTLSISETLRYFIHIFFTVEWMASENVKTFYIFIIAVIVLA